MILSGRKRHTIRAKRKRPTKVGEMLYLYTGLRTKYTQHLLDSPCTKNEDIRIEGDESCPTVIVEGEELNADERERLAYLDGFESFAEMAAFWNGRLPFHGDITHWQ
jgi:hypothetical protein